MLPGGGSCGRQKPNENTLLITLNFRKKPPNNKLKREVRIVMEKQEKPHFL